MPLPCSGRWFFPICFFTSSLICGSLPEVATAQLVQSTPLSEGSTSCSTDDLHVFIIHGWDPLDLAKLRGLKACCQSWGFSNTVLKQCYERKSICKEIAAIRACKPKARFALIGFSAGATVAREITHDLHHCQGIDVQLLIYLGGNLLGWHKENCPPYVERVIHVRSIDDCVLAPRIQGAEMHTIAPAWHFSSPYHPKTRCLIQDSLNEIIGGSTAPVPMAPAP